MSSPRSIVLWDPSLNANHSSDQAGIDIQNSVYAPPAFFRPPPYQQSAASTSTPLPYVPSLAYFCIKAVVESPEDVHFFGSPRISYEKHTHGTYDILRALMPQAYNPHDKDPSHIRLDQVDPRLWASVIQVFRDLPPHLRAYTIALADSHLCLLQYIPASPDFTLLTVLHLSGVSHLNDNTVFKLKHLHALSALDASDTALTAYGIRRLSETLGWAERSDDAVSRRRGPWELRILLLRSCRKITNKIFEVLDRFPLLSVVDLRDTNCNLQKLSYKSAFEPSLDEALPGMSLTQMVSILGRQSGFFSSANQYVLHVDRLHYGDFAVGLDKTTFSSSRLTPPVAAEDSFVVFDKTSRATVASGVSKSSERSNRTAEEAPRHMEPPSFEIPDGYSSCNGCGSSHCHPDSGNPDDWYPNDWDQDSEMGGSEQYDDEQDDDEQEEDEQEDGEQEDGEREDSDEEYDSDDIDRNTFAIERILGTRRTPLAHRRTYEHRSCNRGCRSCGHTGCRTFLQLSHNEATTTTVTLFLPSLIFELHPSTSGRTPFPLS
ncbi:hypothetical protein OF83DRAFT_878908 [Amylostereum chailletii]|nr:hypothetical protein OF83DRAFT_878908 [Amylostereum chailletii]